MTTARSPRHQRHKLWTLPLEVASLRSVISMSSTMVLYGAKNGPAPPLKCQSLSEHRLGVAASAVAYSYHPASGNTVDPLPLFPLRPILYRVAGKDSVTAPGFIRGLCHQLVGQPCGQHGQYTFYKALRVSGDREQIIAIGDFFFVRIWQDSELVSIDLTSPEDPSLTLPDRILHGVHKLKFETHRPGRLAPAVLHKRVHAPTINQEVD
ncbi:AT-rich interactive domain-containing protein 5B [Eumeta japonica]|uniref:AT-rich interactive domain-containing protein 5B n=1 Tax=Eumeta variegata TaxID=151549 RepID=A0A4C1XPN3_EUMVA|nr:AT-rich interactive domain-containing protein 5B [Eumeta japonica]